MKIIPTMVHGVLDYMSAIVLFALPRLLGWSSGITTLLTVLAGGLVVYSLITRYELSIAKLLPMAGHLLLDGIAGVGLIIAGLLFNADGPGVFPWLAALGVFELVVTLLTQTHSPIEAGGSTGTSTSSMTGGARTYSTDSTTTAGTQAEEGMAREVGGVRIYDDKNNR